MSNDFTSFSSKWAVENKTFFFSLDEDVYQTIVLVPSTDIQGRRKVKNFRVSFSIRSDEAETEQQACWILAHVPEVNQGQAVGRPIFPTVGTCNHVWVPPDQVISCGACNAFSRGGVISVPLSRLIDSGDHVIFCVRNMSDTIPLNCAACVSYAICYD
jgi:hypothetical protein